MADQSCEREETREVKYRLSTEELAQFIWGCLDPTMPEDGKGVDITKFEMDGDDESFFLIEAVVKRRPEEASYEDASAEIPEEEGCECACEGDHEKAVKIIVDLVVAGLKKLATVK